MVEYTISDYIISFICNINREIKYTLANFTENLVINSNTIMLLDNVCNNLCRYD